MSNAVLDKAREKFLSGDATLLYSSISKLKAALVDLDFAGAAQGAYVIAACTFASTTITVTTAANHGLIVGDVVAISNIAGFTTNNPNGNWTVATQNGTTQFTFVAALAPTGAYTASTGRVFRMSGTFLADNLGVAGAITTNARSAAMTSVTNLLGVAAAATATCSAVPTIGATTTGDHTCEGIIVYQAALTFAGSDLADSACRMIYWIDTATGLPVTPNGGDVQIAWNGSGLFKL